MKAVIYKLLYPRMMKKGKVIQTKDKTKEGQNILFQLKISIIAK